MSFTLDSPHYYINTPVALVVGSGDLEGREATRCCSLLGSPTAWRAYFDTKSFEEAFKSARKILCLFLCKLDLPFVTHQGH